MSASEMYLPLIDAAFGDGSVADEEEAFGEIYRLHHDKILRYCCYRLRDRHEAEDVTQEAFARAWRSMPTFPSDRNFYPWLRVVAGNLCTDVQRKRSRSEPVAAIDAGFVDGNIDRLTDDVDRVLVREALGRLNARHRSALMMREDEGLTYDQIAARTGATTATVESLLWRARQALKKEFTVLAGREGCLAVVPGLALVGIRLRSAGRQAWMRAVRRLPALGQAGSDSPAAHLLMAAVATIAMVTGVTVGLGLGGHRASAPVQLADRVSTASAEGSANAPVRARPASSTVEPPAPPAGDPATRSSVTGAVTSARASAAPVPVPGAAPARAAGLATVEVLDPVHIGRTEAAEAHKDPVALSAGNVTVGVNAPATVKYIDKTLARLAAPVPPSTPAVSTTPILKESTK